MFVILAITWILRADHSGRSASRTIDMTWYRAKNAESRVADFEQESKNWSPDGSAVNFEEEMRRIRDDPKGRKDPMKLKPQEPEEFLAEFQPFCDMMTRRASAHLWQLATHSNGSRGYLLEQPEDLDAAGNFATEGRRIASDARLWATIFEDMARTQKTPGALVPYSDPMNPLDILQDRIQLDSRELESIAAEKLGMDLAAIRVTVTGRVADLETPKGEAEIARRVGRIHDEYIDGARVFWAIDEMKKRPLSAFVAIDAAPTSWVGQMEPTGNPQADAGFSPGDVEDVLNEYHKRLSMLLPEAYKLRGESIRETGIVPGIPLPLHGLRRARSRLRSHGGRQWKMSEGTCNLA